MLQRPGTLRPDAVFYEPDAGDWFLEADCPSCDGYRMALRVPDPDKRVLAEVRASAFLEGVHSLACLGCQARARLEGELEPAGELDVWWDPGTGEWMAPFPGTAGSAMPLGIRSYWAGQEARAAARALRDASPLALRVAAEPAEVEPDSCTVVYDAGRGRWRLQVPCFDCGGFELRLATLGRGNVDTAADEALGCLDRMADEGCPHCRAVKERGGCGDSLEEPRLWYDTTAGEWVVWRPLGGPGNGITLPLGISRYDVDESNLLRTASDLLFGRGRWLGADGEIP